MASLIAAGNGSHYFSNARRDTQRGQEFKAKENVEVKTVSGAKIQVYPTLDSTAPSAEVEHAFETGKQAVFNQKTIPIQEGLALIAKRLGQSVQFGAVLHKHNNFLDAELFDPANFSNKIYANAAGGALNTAIRRANPVLGLTRCFKPVVLIGPAPNTKPDGAVYLTVDTTIRKEAKSASITLLGRNKEVIGEAAGNSTRCLAN